jgi:hypothetical protein
LDKQKITKALVKIGVKRSLKGFDYLTSCIGHEIEKSRTVWSCIRTVADEFGCEYATIEHCIRTAVSSCNKNIAPEDRARLFGNQKMTTAVFVKTVASCIKDGTL